MYSMQPMVMSTVSSICN